MKLDRICQNCGSFFEHASDIGAGLGICIGDEAFEEFFEYILENSDFTCCYDLYLKKRFHGEKAACDSFEELEYIENTQDDEIYGHPLIEQMKKENVDEIIKHLYSTDSMYAKKAIAILTPYIAIGNNDAYEGLLKYYNGLGMADNLEDVHRRVNIVNTLALKNGERKIIDAFLNELDRTPSNNVTKQLYAQILKLLRQCPEDMVRGPILALLEKKKFSYKMRKKIFEIVEEKPEGRFDWLLVD